MSANKSECSVSKEQIEDYQRAEAKSMFEDLCKIFYVPYELFDSKQTHANIMRDLCEVRFLNNLYVNDRKTTEAPKRNYSEYNTDAEYGKAVYAMPSKNTQSEGFEAKKGNDIDFES